MVRIAYLDCSSGISGDMTVAALIDAGVDFATLRRAVDSLGLPGVHLSATEVMRSGFRATHLRVEHAEQHAHRHLSDIVQLIDRATEITAHQKDLARRIFTILAEAEARVHGASIDQIHFHEVGAIDSIVDVIAAAVGFDLLGAAEITASPVPTGRGEVHIAHGRCALPAPGTAELLKGVPLVDVPVDAELTTPTGAAILRSVVGRFGPLPAMTIDRVGYGAGTRNFADRPNVVRLFVGEGAVAARGEEADTVVVLETSLDDVPGEIVGYTRQKLLAAGALDVFATAIQMKKDRPGVLLTVIGRLESCDCLEAILFAETGTFGIRRTTAQRSKRRRTAVSVTTPWGAVQGKLGTVGGQVLFTPEYESCVRVAAQFNVPLREVYRAAEAAFAADPQAAASVDSSATAEPAEVHADGRQPARPGDTHRHDEHHHH
ncbi:MAG: nickel pincer cofactor biosynthesis protein LarC [Planctomycetaceae bacterium]